MHIRHGCRNDRAKRHGILARDVTGLARCAFRLMEEKCPICYVRKMTGHDIDTAHKLERCIHEKREIVKSFKRSSLQQACLANCAQCHKKRAMIASTLPDRAKKDVCIVGLCERLWRL